MADSGAAGQGEPGMQDTASTGDGDPAGAGDPGFGDSAGSGDALPDMRDNEPSFEEVMAAMEDAMGEGQAGGAGQDGGQGQQAGGGSQGQGQGSAGQAGGSPGGEGKCVYGTTNRVFIGRWRRGQPIAGKLYNNQGQLLQQGNSGWGVELAVD